MLSVVATNAGAMALTVVSFMLMGVVASLEPSRLTRPWTTLITLTMTGGTGGSSVMYGANNHVYDRCNVMHSFLH